MLLEEKFKLFRKILKLRQSDLAEVLKSTTGKIKQIEGGNTKTISYDDAKILEKRYNISEQWLRFDIEPMFLEDRTLFQISKYKDELFLNENLVELQYYINIESYIKKEKSITIKTPSFLVSNLKQDLISFKIEDSSMETSFMENDLIVLDESITSLINGKVYIVKYEEQYLIRRFFSIPSKAFLLKADNPIFPDIEVIDIKNFEVIAKIVSTIRSRTA